MNITSAGINSDSNHAIRYSTRMLYIAKIRQFDEWIVLNYPVMIHDDGNNVVMKYESISKRIIVEYLEHLNTSTQQHWMAGHPEVHGVLRHDFSRSHARKYTVAFKRAIKYLYESKGIPLEFEQSASSLDSLIGKRRAMQQDGGSGNRD